MKYSPDQHDGIVPATPESETPETDAHLSHLNLPDGSKVGIPLETVYLLGSLERRLAQAQGEREEYEAGFAAANERADMATIALAHWQARVAELEKERDTLKHHIAVTEALRDRA